RIGSCNIGGEHPALPSGSFPDSGLEPESPSRNSMSNDTGASQSTSSAKTTMKVPTLLFSAAPAGDPDEGRRRLEICRRELRSWAEHLQRSHRVQMAHYDQLAWLRVQINEQQARLQEEDERLGGWRTELLKRQRELDERQHELDDRKKR